MHTTLVRHHDAWIWNTRRFATRLTINRNQGVVPQFRKFWRMWRNGDRALGKWLWLWGNMESNNIIYGNTCKLESIPADRRMVRPFASGPAINCAGGRTQMRSPVRLWRTEIFKHSFQSYQSEENIPKTPRALLFETMGIILKKRKGYDRRSRLHSKDFTTQHRFPLLNWIRSIRAEN